MIEYDYDMTTGLLTSVTVNDSSSTSGNDIMTVEYTYQDDSATYGGELGSAGDLVLVKVSRKATHGNDIVRYTHYRYYTDDDTSGKGNGHQLKAVYEADAVQRVVDGELLVDPTGILDEADVDIEAYASRKFTYYVDNNTNTSGVNTPWPSASENLGNVCGGTDISEYNATLKSGRVQTETINGVCGCGGGASNGIMKYYYYREHAGASDYDDVELLVVEDTVDSTGTAAYRKVYGLNERGVVLREAFLESNDVEPGNDEYPWCSSIIVDSSYRVTERRLPSAHTIVDTNSKLLKFFNPQTSTNDVDTAEDSLGVVYHYEYDGTNGDGKHLTGVLVSRGIDDGDSETGDELPHYISAIDWGDATNTNEQPWAPTARYVYPAKATTRNDSSRIKIADYDYVSWDDVNSNSDWDEGEAIKQITITSPDTSTQNGPGSISSYQFFDTYSRLRWTKDGEGYVNYYSYNPDTGGRAFVALDVCDDYSPAADSNWLPESAGGADTLQPSRGASLPMELQLVSTTIFDELGRANQLTDAGGKVHITKYFTNGVAKFPYVVSNTATLPVQVTKLDGGGTMTDSISFDPAGFSASSATTTIPTDQDDYVSWARYFYDTKDGQLNKVLRYHNIPSSGDGTHLTNYYVTAYEYDDLGRSETTVQTVQSVSGAYDDQISQVVYDDLDRVIETKKTAGDSGVNTSANATVGTITLTGLETTSETVYDAGNVGDSRVTSQLAFYGTGANDYINSIPKYTFRGHVRGVNHFNGNGDYFGPYTVRDIDWMGRTTATARYAWGATTDWDDVITGDGYSDYIAGNSPNRNDWVKIYYDKVGQVYKREAFPGTQSTKYFLTNNYHDYRGNLVATQTDGSAAMEYVIDGVGRQYEERTVIALESTKYSGGLFNFVSPKPDPTFSNMSGTDGGVISMTHTEFDSGSRAITQHAIENHHDDPDGVDFSNDDDYIRETVHTFFDGANRPTAVANYGSSDGSSSNNDWRFVTAPSHPGTAPVWTDVGVFGGKILLTTFGYDTAGRRNDVTIGVKKAGGDDTVKTTTKTFYDDFGRQLFVVENHDSFDPTSTDPNSYSYTSGTNRTTGFVYNGAGQVVLLKAYHNGGSSSHQRTRYLYEDDDNTSLATKVIYQATSDTATSGTDQVQMDYNLDGSLVSRTDQRDIVLTYKYNDRRQVIYEDASATSGTVASKDVDEFVLSIGRTYDTLGRLTFVTSYDDVSTGSPTKLNEVKYNYDVTTNFGLLEKTEQEHDGAVSSSPSVQYSYDASASSNVLSNGLRMETVTYPAGDIKFYDFGTGGSNNDLLHRVEEIWETNNSTGTQLTSYSYNGLSRVAETRLHTSSNRYFHADGDNNGVYDRWDRFGRIIDSTWRDSVPNFYDRFLYSYDFAGNRTSRIAITSGTDSVGGATSHEWDQLFTYDGLQRLATAERGTDTGDNGSIDTRAFAQQWTLDQLGNWSDFKQDTDGNGNFSGGTDIDQDRVHNNVNEIKAATGDSIDEAGSGTGDWADPAYDLAGNMTTVPMPKSLGSSYTGTYDAWNRLVSLDWTTIKYSYDGLHRRILRDETGEGGDIIHFYYNENWQCVEERIVSGSTEQSNPVKQYVWHPQYIDGLAVIYYDADFDANLSENDDGTYFAMFDANFNVTGIFDDAGAVVERYHYTPYGEVTVLDADFTLDSDGGDGLSDIENEFLYTGRRLDPVTGLQLNRRRYYHPQLGRWLTRDPIGYSAGDMNLYGYVGGMPTYYVDPMGLACGENADDGNAANADCKIEIRCGKVLGSLRHCGVMVDGIEYGIGGDAGRDDRWSIPLPIRWIPPNIPTLWGGGGAIPPEYPEQPFPQPPPNPPNLQDGQTSYPGTCKGRSCKEVTECIQRHMTLTEPPPYAAIGGPNSNTYAHRLLEVCGCTVDPYKATFRGWEYESITPGGAWGWNHPGYEGWGLPAPISIERKADVP